MGQAESSIRADVEENFRRLLKARNKKDQERWEEEEEEEAALTNQLKEANKDEVNENEEEEGSVIDATKRLEIDYLLLEDVIKFPSPPEHTISLNHLGTLFVLNSPEFDGRFRLEQFHRFIDECVAHEALQRKYDIQTHIHARSTIEMWKTVTADQEAFIAWFLSLITANLMSVRFLAAYPGVSFVEEGPIVTIHSLLDIEPMYGIDFQEFFELLQRVAQQRGFVAIAPKRHNNNNNNNNTNNNNNNNNHINNSIPQVQQVQSQGFSHSPSMTTISSLDVAGSSGSMSIPNFSSLGLIVDDQEDLLPVIPVQVLEIFARGFVKGFTRIMRDFGFVIDE